MHTHNNNFPAKQELFNQYIQQTIENYSFEVDEDCWKRIDRSLNRRRTAKLFLRVVGSAAMVAALFLLVFSLARITEDDQLLPVGTVARQDIKKQEQVIGSTSGSETSVPLLSEERYVAPAVIAEREAADVPPDTSAVPEEREGETAEATTLAVPRADQSVGPPTPSGKRPSGYRPYTKQDKPNRAKSSRAWTLAATVSMSGSKTDNDSPLLSQGPEFLPDPTAITDLGFAPPFSVGVLVHKELNQTFGVETGVMYSYLSTSYRDVNYMYKADLKLHYIGIPLSFTANLWQSHPSWRLYTSGGIMAEKGLQAELTQRLYASDKVVERKARMDGWQWSLQLSAGISYRLSKDWEIYLEPKLSYYFNNSQPLSIRTEKPLLPGIGSGIRYVF